MNVPRVFARLYQRPGHGVAFPAMSGLPRNLGGFKETAATIPITRENIDLPSNNAFLETFHSNLIYKLTYPLLAEAASAWRGLTRRQPHEPTQFIRIFRRSSGQGMMRPGSPVGEPHAGTPRQRNYQPLGARRPGNFLMIRSRANNAHPRRQPTEGQKTTALARKRAELIIL